MLSLYETGSRQRIPGTRGSRYAPSGGDPLPLHPEGTPRLGGADCHPTPSGEPRGPVARG